MKRYLLLILLAVCLPSMAQAEIAWDKTSEVYGTFSFNLGTANGNTITSASGTSSVLPIPWDWEKAAVSIRAGTTVYCATLITQATAAGPIDNASLELTMFLRKEDADFYVAYHGAREVQSASSYIPEVNSGEREWVAVNDNLFDYYGTYLEIPIIPGGYMVLKYTPLDAGSVVNINDHGMRVFIRFYRRLTRY